MHGMSPRPSRPTPARRGSRQPGPVRGDETPAAPRRPGRPRADTRPGEPREALLDLAADLFGTRGFAACTVRDIARAARVTPALANYYFGDKAGLLDAVVEHRVGPLAAGISMAVAGAGPDPREAIAAFVRTYTATAARHRWLPRLIVREVISEGGVLRERLARRFADAVAGALGERMREAQRTGLVRADLDPAHLVMSLVSLCIFPFIAAPLVDGVLGVDTSPAQVDALADHHLALFWAGASP